MRIRLALLAVVGLALGLRLWGITFGLPYDYQISEQMYVRAASGVAREGVEGISPLFGTYQILLLLEHRLLRLVEPLLAALDLGPRLSAALAPPRVFNLLGRLTSAVLGALTVLPLYAVGRRLWNPAAGLLAALFLAVAYIHVVNSHYAKPDATVVFLATVVLLLCVRIAESGRARDYALAGLLSGLAVTAKPLAFPLVVAIAGSHLVREGRERPLPDGAGERALRRARSLFDRRLLLAALLTIAALLATAPQILTKPKEVREFYAWVASAAEHGGMFRFDIHFGQPGWKVYLYALHWGLGDLLAILAFGGLVFFLVRRRPRPLLPLIASALVLLAFLLLPGQYVHARYLLLALPVLLLCAAGLPVEAAARLPIAGPARRVLAATALAAVLLHPLASSVLHDRLLTREDTRTLAKRWIEERIPEGSKVALELWPYAPQLSSAERPTPFSRRTFEITTSGVYGLSEKSKRAGTSEGNWTVDEYIREGVEYVVTDGFSSSLPLVDPAEERRKRDFYAELHRKGYLVQDFSPAREGRRVPFVFDQIYGPTVGLLGFERPGPPLKIYRLPPAAGTLGPVPADAP